MPRACEEEPGQPRMGRQSEKIDAQRRDAVAAPRLALDRTQVGQQPAGIGDRLRRRRIEPGKVAILAEGKQLEKRTGKITADRLGCFGRRAVLV